MNRQQKRKSRMIKAYIRWVRDNTGAIISYEAADGQLRRFYRAMNSHSKGQHTRIIKWRKLRSKAYIQECQKSFELINPVQATKLPGDPNWVIDETPIEEPTEMWPKENPHLTHIEKEN